MANRPRKPLVVQMVPGGKPKLFNVCVRDALNRDFGIAAAAALRIRATSSGKGALPTGTPEEIKKFDDYVESVYDDLPLEFPDDYEAVDDDNPFFHALQQRAVRDMGRLTFPQSKLLSEAWGKAVRTRFIQHVTQCRLGPGDV